MISKQIPKLKFATLNLHFVILETRYKKHATKFFLTVIHHRSQRLVLRTKTNHQTPGAFLHRLHYFFPRKYRNLYDDVEDDDQVHFGVSRFELSSD